MTSHQLKELDEEMDTDVCPIVTDIMMDKYRALILERTMRGIVADVPSTIKLKDNVLLDTTTSI
ncbi:MAG: hypothetical protein HAW67_03285 [Endozoicomonadaceae bacterium]|nr:hypothetical protein [Endozoicomonadaceae bacterium]